MSRISMQLAGEIAQELTKPQRAKLQEAKYRLAVKVGNAWIEKEVPEKVMALAQEHPKFFSLHNAIRLNGNGFSYCDFQFPASLEVPYWRSGGPWTPDAEDAKWIQKEKQVLDKEDKRIRDLVKSIETALLNMRTFKRIREEFPEATPYLPDNSKPVYLPVVNVKAIRDQLK
jgi:hypothetical protein